MNTEPILNSVEEAIEDFRNGKIVIVVDDEDRENEGDFIIAAEKITPEIVNFMLKEGRGVLCAPLSEERCEQLGLNMMEENNTSLLGTPFTVTVDLLGHDCTTGVSIHDRAATIRALADPNTKPCDLGRPGHINPLRARQKGVLRRPGHTEAAVDLARLAGLQPAGALIEIMNEDGTMARLPQLMEVARKFGLKIVSIASLIAYRLREESIVEKGVTVPLPTEWGDFRITPFRQKSNGVEHAAVQADELRHLLLLWLLPLRPRTEDALQKVVHRHIAMFLVLHEEFAVLGRASLTEVLLDLAVRPDLRNMDDRAVAAAILT